MAKGKSLMAKGKSLMAKGKSLKAKVYGKDNRLITFYFDLNSRLIYIIEKKYKQIET